MKLSIIIPAYNEEDRIVKTLENTLFYLNKQNYYSEIIVVSDGSTDETKKVTEGFDPGEKVTLKVIEYKPNRGKGYAVRFGMLRGSGDYIMFMDADYSVPIKELEKGIKLLNNDIDIVIASRAISGSVINDRQSFFRQLSGKIYTLIQNCYLGIRYKDTQCGFKIFTKHSAHELFGMQRLDSVIFDPEILWLAKQRGFKVVEFPVTWSHVVDSRIVYDNIRKSLFIFQELLRIRILHR